MNESNTNLTFKDGKNVMILGIVSAVSVLVSCCIPVPFLFVIPLIIGFLGLTKGNKALKAAKAMGHDPKSYSNYSNLNLGRILSIVGLVLGGIMLLMTIIAIAVYGIGIVTNPEEAQRILQELQEQLQEQQQ